eukprot:TRINITY_DN994_c0_g1_i1.p1 TRINITY_DN994_c0_g1~~TRINITY_DN994_c0_g1_i1.p1  ORF type:complete len:223 (+),score=30.55 TRINITY_DN994_c0_g1_i1:69-737(+)
MATHFVSPRIQADIASRCARRHLRANYHDHSCFLEQILLGKLGIFDRQRQYFKRQLDHEQSRAMLVINSATSTAAQKLDAVKVLFVIRQWQPAINISGSMLYQLKQEVDRLVDMICSHPATFTRPFPKAIARDIFRHDSGNTQLPSWPELQRVLAPERLSATPLAPESARAISPFPATSAPYPRPPSHNASHDASDGNKPDGEEQDPDDVCVFIVDDDVTCL